MWPLIKCVVNLSLCGSYKHLYNLLEAVCSSALLLRSPFWCVTEELWGVLQNLCVIRCINPIMSDTCTITWMIIPTRWGLQKKSWLPLFVLYTELHIMWITIQVLNFIKLSSVLSSLPPFSEKKHLPERDISNVYI